MLYYMSVVSRVPLNEACDPADICADGNADCLAGVCTCMPLYYENNARCGMRFIPTVIVIYCMVVVYLLVYLGRPER